jgi:cytochrome P450
MFLYLLYILIKDLVSILIIIFIYNKIIFYNFKAPLSLPILGNLYTQKSFKTISYLNYCKEKYGKIFLFWAGIKSMVVVCDPQVVRNILSDNTNFKKGENYTQKFSFVFGNILVTSN